MKLTQQQRKEILDQLEFNWLTCSIWRRWKYGRWVINFKEKNYLSKSAKAYLLPIYERRLARAHVSVELYTGIINALKSKD